MRPFYLWMALAVGLLACSGAHAQGLLGTCHASTSYDVTIKPNGVLFDRTQPAPRRVFLHGGKLTLDGVPVALDAGDSHRVMQIEHIVRGLEPKVKALADHGVDLAAQAVREQAAMTSPGASGELDTRLATIARDLKARIARSQSSHDWHGPAFRQYANQTMASIVPLLASGLLQQAVTAALSGNLDAAAGLRQRATHMATALRARIRKKLEVLRPQVLALCPSLQRMNQLESGIHTPLPNGEHINLVDIAATRPESPGS